MDLLELLGGQLEGRVQQIGSQIGADHDATAKGIEMALPVLVGALANNANRSPEGAQALARAVDRDHSPDLLDQLGGLLGGGGGAGALGALLGGSSGSGGGGLGSLLGAAAAALGGGGGPKALDGAGILGHILGGRRGGVETGISRSSGLSASQVGQLLMLLAPLVMSAVAKMKQQGGLDHSGLASALRDQRTRMEQATPGMGHGGLADLLDRDHDGQIADDLASLGATLGGALFGRR